MPPDLTGPRTQAPAPSPNNTQVSLFLQSIKPEIRSAAMTGARGYKPVWINCLAVVMAYKYPEHAAETSKAAAFLAPMAFWTLQATDGKLLSGEMVATMIKSILSAEILALLSA